MKIGLVGDTHGRDLYKIENVMHCDLIIVLGDFGFNGKNLIELCYILKSNNKTLLFVDGNHEKFNKINRSKEIGLYGSTVDVYANNIYRLKRGHIYNIDGHKFLAFGGAKSLDRHIRVDNIDWFDCEEYNNDEKETLIENLIANNYKVDYILTHDCPSTLSELIYSREDCFYSRTSTLLSNISQMVEFKNWFFGHHHIDDQYGKYYALWENQIILDIRDNIGGA